MRKLKNKFPKQQKAAKTVGSINYSKINDQGNGLAGTSNGQILSNTIGPLENHPSNIRPTSCSPNQGFDYSGST